MHRLKPLYFVLILLLCLCVPAQAKVTIGLAPSVTKLSKAQSDLDQLAKALTGKLNEPVAIRAFSDETGVENWLLRYQELDAALVSQAFRKNQPAGAIYHLVDLHVSGKGPTVALVTPSQASIEQRRTLQKAFLDLDQDALLRKLGLDGITRPGQALKVPPKPVVKAEPKTPKPRPEPIAAKPAQQPETKPVKPAEPTPAPKAPTKPKPVVEGFEPVAKPAKPAPAAKAPALPPPEQPAPITETVVTDQPAPQPPKEEPKPADERPRQAPPAPEPPAVATPAGKGFQKQLTLFVILVILIGVAFKAFLLYRRWQGNKPTVARAPEARPATPPKAPAKPAEKPAAPPVKPAIVPSPKPEPVTTLPPLESDQLVIEAGELGPGKVPALLKRCADLPEPVMLHVRKGLCEKIVHFAGGQIASAHIQNCPSAGIVIRWQKLGNLLIRENLISESERDQALELMDREPGLRLGEALIKLKLIDLAGLRHALTRQAKVTIYSLILFPEGAYRVTTDDGSLPAEESVSLEVTNLLRDASHHQAEWTAIRKALPSLNTVVDFQPEGQEKVAQVRLSDHQQKVLNLIDGRRTINDLCTEAPMMDYELFRFLYLMMKAGILQKTSTKARKRKA